jgi:hypothetical protein
VNIRMRSPALDFYVDVRLRAFGQRWLAVADIAGEPEVGLACTAREALLASMASLGSAAATALLADPTLPPVIEPVTEDRR